jgi:anti-sigma B factor antagonist
MVARMGEPVAEFVTTADGDVAIIRVIGQVDVSNAQQLADAMSAAKADTVIDLSECDFIDSFGIGTLMAGQRMLKKEGKRTAIACVPSGALDRVLSVTGLQDVFPVHKDTADALAALRAGDPSD